METMNLSKKRFDSLEKYKLPESVFNTEAQLYILPVKNKWESTTKIFKKLYITNGPTFGNKLQTINSLIDLKDEIDMKEIVLTHRKNGMAVLFLTLVLYLGAIALIVYAGI